MLRIDISAHPPALPGAAFPQVGEWVGSPFHRPDGRTLVRRLYQQVGKFGARRSKAAAARPFSVSSGDSPGTLQYCEIYPAGGGGGCVREHAGVGRSLSKSSSNLPRRLTECARQISKLSILISTNERRAPD